MNHCYTQKPLEGFVKIKSARSCHKKIVGCVGEIFGYHITRGGRRKYGVSLDGADYELYENELESVGTVI